MVRARARRRTGGRLARWSWRGRPDGSVELTLDELVKDALLVALEVARDVEEAAPPARLRPFLNHQRVTTSLLATVRRVLDEDDAFRERVLSQVEETKIDADSLLFLSRPEGWDALLEARLDERAARVEAGSGAREERRASKRLEATEEKLARVRAELAAAKTEVTTARAEAAEARKARSLLDTELDVAKASATSALAARDGERRRAEVAEATVTRLRADLAERAAAEPAPVELGPETAAPPPPLDSAPAAAASPPVDPELVSGVRAAASAASDLASALARVAAVLGGGEQSDPAPRPDVQLAPTTEREARARLPRRKRLAPPPATMADTLEAAAHFVRVPGVLVVVDGYNVSKLAWPDSTPVDQRGRLTAALEGLQARARCEVLVVWDGAEGNEPSRGAVATRIRTTFSPPDITADEVIISTARDTHPEQALVVVSNDREVRDGTEAWGATVVSSDHLLELLSRR